MTKSSRPKLHELANPDISPLKRARLERGLSLGQLARLLPGPPTSQAVGLWENGKRKPSRAFQPGLARILGITQRQLRGMLAETAVWQLNRRELRRDKRELGEALRVSPAEAGEPLAVAYDAGEHPDTETLALFVEGRLGEDAREALMDHLEACRRCLSVVGTAVDFAEGEDCEGVGGAA